MADNPHFKLPFRFGKDGHADVVEQDSTDDVKQCVEAIMRTPQGFRLEIPGFGIEDPNFIENGPDEISLRRAIDAWEPRADYDILIAPDRDDPKKWTVQIEIQGSDET